MSSEQSLQHLGIIMDGNRRWATERGMPKFLGHTEGAKNLKKIAKAVKEKGIRFLTLYTLSTENLKERSPEELDHLFSLITQLIDYLDEFLKENTRLRVIGDYTKLPEKPRRALEEIMEKTKDHTDFTLTLAINYGGRDEITRAVKKIVEAKISAQEVTENTLEKFLDTTEMPEIDLVIRTSGAQRLSNFLPWQSTYAELYFTPVHWPAFSPQDLDTAIAWFQEQKRNKGK